MKPSRSTAARQSPHQAAAVLPGDPDVASGTHEDEALQGEDTAASDEVPQREDVASGPGDADGQRLDPAAAQDDEHWQRIRELAYTLAAARGFHPGHELDDWLEAERQVWLEAERQIGTEPVDTAARTGR